MNINVTVSISKAANNNNRIIEFYPICLPTQEGEVELRLLCTRYELDGNNDKIVNTAKLFTPTTIGEYVDATGKKKDKNDTGALKKGDYYKDKLTSGSKSIIEQYFDIFRSEIDELDKQNYFD